MNPTALAEVIFHHHILSQLLFAGQDRPLEAPSAACLCWLPNGDISCIQRRAGRSESSPSPLSAALWLAEKHCYLQIVCLAWFCRLLIQLLSLLVLLLVADFLLKVDVYLSLLPPGRDFLEQVSPAFGARASICFS